jgi:hypothetical protein
MVLALIILIGSITVALTLRSKKSFQEVAELTYEHQVAKLANSYAEVGLRLLSQSIASGIEPANPLVNTQHLLDFENESVVVNYAKDHFEGIDLPPNDFVITSIATLRASNGFTYISEVNIHYGDGRPLSGDEDPYSTDLTGIDFSKPLIIRLEPGGVNMTVANNNSKQNMHQHWDQLDSHSFLYVTVEELHQHGYVIKVPKPIPGNYAQITDYTGNASITANGVPYPLTLWIDTAQVMIDGNIRSNFPINIIAGDGIMQFSGQKANSPDPLLISENIHLYASGAITVPSSKPTVINRGTVVVGQVHPGDAPNPDDFMIGGDTNDDVCCDGLCTVKGCCGDDCNVDGCECSIILPPIIKNWTEKPVIIIPTI